MVPLSTITSPKKPCDVWNVLVRLNRWEELLTTVFVMCCENELPALPAYFNPKVRMYVMFDEFAGQCQLVITVRFVRLLVKKAVLNHLYTVAVPP